MTIRAWLMLLLSLFEGKRAQTFAQHNHNRNGSPFYGRPSVW